MKNAKTTLALVLSCVALILAAWSVFHSSGTSVQKASVYDRIMKDRTIRCAYQPWPPFLAKDPNTGEISGVYADIFKQIGQDLNLKIDWVEEVGSANTFEGYTTGRYDMLCSPITSTPQRALVSGFVRPFGYLPYYAYVREGDPRFDNAYDKMDNESITMMGLDGDFTSIVANEEFPKAKKVNLPNMMNGADLLTSLASGKADVVINDPSIADVFMKTNSGKVRRVEGPPVRFLAVSISLPLGEERLRELMNQTVTHYLDVGKIDKILNSYDLDETKILRIAPPYRDPSAKGKGAE
ncbi:MAG: substrate-binding periplasmic protein [Bdellovibrionales bacterium]